MTPDATALLERARQVEHAADLYTGAARVEPERLAEVLRDVEPGSLDERTLWNLLFCAGEVSQRVDVYRAHELFVAARSLVQRADEPDPQRAAILEMCFDFFFARRTPLVPLRGKEIIASLGELLEGSRPARRAAIHGLGHLVALGRDQSWANDAIALLDALASGETDAELRRYAEEARTGQLA